MMIFETRSFSSYVELEQFVNSNRIAKGNIQQITVSGNTNGTFVLFYWR